MKAVMLGEDIPRLSVGALRDRRLFSRIPFGMKHSVILPLSNIPFGMKRGAFWPLSKIGFGMERGVFQPLSRIAFGMEMAYIP
jgi:hypothetical protein